MAAQNDWEIGAFYIQPNGFNGQWTQPGGVGTQVFPADATGNDYFSTAPFSEASGIFVSACSHSVNYPTLIQDVDVTTGEQIMLVVCPKCSYINYVLPLEQALSTVQTPIIPI